MKTKNRSLNIPVIALEGEKALKAAVAEVVAEHKKAGKPLAVWYNGKAVLMAPDKALSAVRENRATYTTKRKQT